MSITELTGVPKSPNSAIAEVCGHSLRMVLCRRGDGAVGVALEPVDVSARGVRHVVDVTVRDHDRLSLDAVGTVMQVGAVDVDGVVGLVQNRVLERGGALVPPGDLDVGDRRRPLTGDAQAPQVDRAPHNLDIADRALER